jgi:hypothetical protein
VQVFALRARRRATGTLTLSPSGVATTLRFGGTSVRAHAGMTLRFRGLPARLRPRRPASLRLRVLSQFGAPVASALVTVTGDGLALTAVTGPGGLPTVSFTVPRRGRMHVRVSMPGYAPTDTWIRIR